MSNIAQAFQEQQEAINKRVPIYELDYPFMEEVTKYRKFIEDYFKENKAILVEHEVSIIDAFRLLDEIRREFSAISQSYHNIRAHCRDLEKRITWTKHQLKIEHPHEG
jgi:hypothetical protein